MPQLSAQSGFAFTTFGAVAEITVVKKTSVEIPADRAADFARAASWFEANANTENLSFSLATEADAKLFRAQVAQWADEHNRSYQLPEHKGEHTVTRTDDAGNSKTVTVKDNGVPATWNRGANVTFRIGKVRQPKKAANPVTVTQGAPQPVTAGNPANATARDGRS